MDIHLVFHAYEGPLFVLDTQRSRVLRTAGLSPTSSPARRGIASLNSVEQPPSEVHSLALEEWLLEAIPQMFKKHYNGWKLSIEELAYLHDLSAALLRKVGGTPPESDSLNDDHGEDRAALRELQGWESVDQLHISFSETRKEDRTCMAGAAGVLFERYTQLREAEAVSCLLYRVLTLHLQYALRHGSSFGALFIGYRRCRSLREGGMEHPPANFPPSRPESVETRISESLGHGEVLFFTPSVPSTIVHPPAPERLFHSTLAQCEAVSISALDAVRAQRVARSVGKAALLCSLALPSTALDQYHTDELRDTKVSTPFPSLFRKQVRLRHTAAEQEIHESDTRTVWEVVIRPLPSTLLMSEKRVRDTEHIDPTHERKKKPHLKR